MIGPEFMLKFRAMTEERLRATAFIFRTELNETELEMLRTVAEKIGKGPDESRPRGYDRGVHRVGGIRDRGAHNREKGGESPPEE